MAAKFTVRRTPFGLPAGTAADQADAEDLDLPRPLLVKARARRAAGIAEAKDTLALLPGPGESLHAVMTARLDMTDVLNALLEKVGRCDALTVATLGYNARNLKIMLRWLDAGAVGRLTLLASKFFQAHKGDLWEETLTGFRSRGQRAACCHSHAKVATLAFATGERFAVEGSANLCSNGSAREQFAVVHDADLTAWHENWIVQLVTRHEGKTQAATPEKAQADQGRG